MRILLAATLITIAPALAVAQPQSATAPRPHQIDAAHSQINFVADSRLLSAHGHFAKWDAAVQLDPRNWPASSVALTIDAASITTRIDQRDQHLRSADFFDVATHPTITFRSVSVAQAGEGALAITGDLTVRGTTRRVTIPAQLVFYDEGMGRFRGTFTVRRKEYGVAYDSRLNPIRDEVEVQWDMTLKVAQP